MVTYLVEAEVVHRDSGSIENSLHPRTLLANEMNGLLLDQLQGAPARSPVENQPRFKAVTWIEAIEFAEGVRSVSKGEGGYPEGHEYMGEQGRIRHPGRGCSPGEEGDKAWNWA
ncbi:MAG: molybdopterin-dependent oxidoreductase [Thermoanaerobaculales bacterium]